MNRQYESATTGNILAATTLAGGLLALTGCTSNVESAPEATPTWRTGSGSVATSPDVASRNYCTDNPADRGVPLRVEGKKLIVGVHGECAGDPNAPVGIYASPDQQAGRSVAAVPNSTEFAADCTVEGQAISTDAAALSNPSGKTSSTTWLRGSLPANRAAGTELYIPHAMTGFTALQLGSLQLKACA